MSVRFRRPGDEHFIASVPSGGYLAGRLENFNGKTYMLEGLQNKLEGESANFRKGIIVEITKTTAATVFATNVALGYTQATQSVVAAGAGDFDLTGKTVYASGAGAETVLFRLDD